MTRMRENAAVVTSVVATLLGTLVIYRGWAVTSTVAMVVGGVWSFTGSWLGGRFSRAGRAHWQQSLSSIYQQAKEGTLPQDPPLVRGLTGSGTLLILMGIILLITGLSIG